MTILTQLRLNIERRLYKLGFGSQLVRHFLCTQILIAGAGLVLGLLLAWITLWPLLFGLGAVIATYSLWHISRFAQTHVQQQFSLSLGLRLFFGFTARLILIALVLFALIVWLRAPVVPLLLGLTSTVASIAVWGISRLSRKTVKEA